MESLSISCEAAKTVTGEEGTGGSPLGEGRRFDLSLRLEGRSKVDRTAVRGGGTRSKEFFHAGADGGTWI